MRTLTFLLLLSGCTAQAVILPVGGDIGTDTETGSDPDTETDPPVIDNDDDGYAVDDDCDDKDASVNPGEEERCDSVDHNCDGNAFDDACPCDVQLTDDGIYAVCSDRLGFDQAAKVCDDAGMTVTFPANEAVNATIQDFAQTMRQDVWLGITDREREGRWVGLNGESSGYENWERNQPDNWRDGEHCAQLRVWTGGWNDISCDSEMPFICFAE